MRSLSADFDASRLRLRAFWNAHSENAIFQRRFDTLCLQLIAQRKTPFVVSGAYVRIYGLHLFRQCDLDLAFDYQRVPFDPCVESFFGNAGQIRQQRKPIGVLENVYRRTHP